MERITHLSHSYFIQDSEKINKATVLTATLLSEGFHVSREWIRQGNMESCLYPCGREMIHFLKTHQEIRKDIYERIYGRERLSWQEKFAIVKRELNWPETYITKYLNIGYGVNYFRQVRNGEIEPEEFFLKHFQIAYHIDPKWFYENGNCVLLDTKRVMSNRKLIGVRAGINAKDTKYEEFIQIAEGMNTGIEYVLCQDEGNRKYPFGSKMADYLRQHEEDRKIIWQHMGLNMNIDYSSLRKPADTLYGRIAQLRKVYKLSTVELARKTELSPVYIANLKEYRGKITDLVYYKISITMAVGVEWLRDGSTENLAYPVQFEMWQYLLEHEEERHWIWKKMNFASHNL